VSLHPPIVSVSQLTAFDHAQSGGCNRRDWFERAHDLKPEQSDAQSDGSKGHKLLADYFPAGAMPKHRVKMSKAVTAAILKGNLPKPGPDLIIEQRFSGQPMWRLLFDEAKQPLLDEKGDQQREWVPLDVAETLWHGGHPWDGAIDLTYRRGDVPTVVDWKFHGDMEANPPVPAHGLIKTIQLPIYVLAMLRRWPDAKRWKIAHGNIGKTASHGSRIISTVVELDQVRERGEQIAGLLKQMQRTRAAPSQEDVPFNRRSCTAWAGCPHQSICSAFRDNKMNNLSTEEQALFNELDGLDVAPPPAPAAASTKPRVKIDDSLNPTGDVVAPPAGGLQAEDTKAARIARAKAELAAMEAEEAKAEAARVAAAAEAAKPIVCALGCGAVLTKENASKLQSGLWKHIGCPKDQVPKPSIVPKDAPASNPAAASEAPAPAAEPKKRGKTASTELSAGGPVTLEFGPETRALILDLIGALKR